MAFLIFLSVLVVYLLIGGLALLLSWSGDLGKWHEKELKFNDPSYGVRAFSQKLHKYRLYILVYLIGAALLGIAALGLGMQALITLIVSIF